MRSHPLKGETNETAHAETRRHDVRSLLSRPPAWLADQMVHVRREGASPARLAALAAAVAAHLAGDSTRGREVLPAVEAFLTHGVGCDCGECA